MGVTHIHSINPILRIWARSLKIIFRLEVIKEIPRVKIKYTANKKGR